MNTSEMSQIERIFYPGWLMASQLRGGQEVRDGDGLYRRACRLVQDAKAALTEAGYSDISRDHMVYALCALLDESVLSAASRDASGLVSAGERCRAVACAGAAPEPGPSGAGVTDFSHAGGVTGQIQPHEGTVLPGTALSSETVADASTSGARIFVAQPEAPSNIATAKSIPPRFTPVRMFVAGAFSMLVAGSIVQWGWQSFFRTDPLVAQLNSSVAPLPEPLTTTQAWALQQKHTLPDDVIIRTQQQLDRLSRLPPDYALYQGSLLMQQLQALWAEHPEVIALTRQWREQLNAAALPADNLNGWHQGMTQLQQLADRLNGLDEQHGKYMTVSELKSQVFSITQAFNRSVPVEEQLRQLALNPQGQPLPAAQQSQTEMSLNALLNRYGLIVLSTAPADNVRHARKPEVRKATPL